ncbi:hypothetical protein [Trueperella pecoris]|nr:hypothetical protein [Trueperella pecoris]
MPRWQIDAQRRRLLETMAPAAEPAKADAPKKDSKAGKKQKKKS